MSSPRAWTISAQNLSPRQNTRPGNLKKQGRGKEKRFHRPYVVVIFINQTRCVIWLVGSRLEMATEDLVGYSSKSSLRSDSGVGGSSDRDHPDFVKTSFYAAKNTILEELRSTNATTVKRYIPKYCTAVSNFDKQLIIWIQWATVNYYEKYIILMKGYRY